MNVFKEGERGLMSVEGIQILIKIILVFPPQNIFKLLKLVLLYFYLPRDPENIQVVYY
jgi:hypothetical protein